MLKLGENGPLATPMIYHGKRGYLVHLQCRWAFDQQNIPFADRVDLRDDFCMNVPVFGSYTSSWLEERLSIANLLSYNDSSESRLHMRSLTFWMEPIINAGSDNDSQGRAETDTVPQAKIKVKITNNNKMYKSGI